MELRNGLTKGQNASGVVLAHNPPANGNRNLSSEMAGRHRAEKISTRNEKNVVLTDNQTNMHRPSLIAKFNDKKICILEFFLYFTLMTRKNFI